MRGTSARDPWSHFSGRCVRFQHGILDPMHSTLPTALLAALALTACAPPPEAPKQASAPASQSPPPEFRVKLDTSKGPVTVELHHDWAPKGVDHFYTLVKLGFYDGGRFFRCVRNFAVQF